jgi:hypothetical protein
MGLILWRCTVVAELILESTVEEEETDGEGHKGGGIGGEVVCQPIAATPAADRDPQHTHTDRSKVPRDLLYRSNPTQKYHECIAEGKRRRTRTVNKEPGEQIWPQRPRPIAAGADETQHARKPEFTMRQKKKHGRSKKKRRKTDPTVKATSNRPLDP